MTARPTGAGAEDGDRRVEGAHGAAEAGMLFGISVAAEMAGMHAQTLRTYDRIGLVIPARTAGGGRRYSRGDVALLREVQRLSQDEGINLEGIRRIIELTAEVEDLREQVAEMGEEIDRLRAGGGRRGGELVRIQPGNAVVVWQPRGRRH